MANLQSQQARPDSVNSHEKEERALDLRRAGASYRDICKALGVSVATAHKLVARGMKRLIARCEEKAEDIKSMELDRLDKLSLAVWPQAMKGHLQAVDRMLKIMDQRAKLLGAYAPTKIASTNPEGTEERPMTVVALPAQMSQEAWAQAFSKQET